MRVLQTILFIGSLAAVHLPADAQEPPDTIPSDSVIALSGVRVEVARMRAGVIPIVEAPFPVDMISRDRIERVHHSVAEVLENLPGVSLGDQVGSPFQPDLRLRGFSVSPVVGLPQSISVFVDGVRINEADASQVHFNLLPMRDLERVELVRGPAGNFGKNSLAGALNLVTRRGLGDSQVELEVFGGDFGDLGGSLLASGEAAGFDLYSRLSYRQTDGWRMKNHARQLQAFIKVGKRGVQSDAWISYTLSSDSIEGPQALPESWLEGGALPPDISSPPTDRRELQYTGGKGDYFRPRLHFFNAYLERTLNSALEISLSGFARFTDFDQFNDNVTEADAMGLTGIASGGSALQVRYEPNPDVRISSGIDIARNDVDIEILELPNRAFPDLEKNTTELAGTNENNLGLYTDLFWRADQRTALHSSLRFDHVSVPFRDFLDPEHNGDNLFNQITGALGLSRETLPGVRLFMGYARGFRAPVILEITCADPEDPCPLPFELGADPPLDPVTTDSWQVGFRTERSQMSTSVTAYWSEVHNDLFSVVDPEQPTRGFFTNLEGTRRIGLEGSMTIKSIPVLPGASIQGSIAWTRATFETHATLAAPFLEGDEEEEEDEDPDQILPAPVVEPGDRFPLIPAFTAGLAISYERGEYQSDLSLHYVGERFLVGDEGNNEDFGKLAGYALLNLNISRVVGSATLYAEVKNLLNQSYNPFGLISPNVRGPSEEIERFFTPGLPRRMLIGARLRIH